jgi:hypothetical protein
MPPPLAVLQKLLSPQTDSADSGRLPCVEMDAYIITPPVLQQSGIGFDIVSADSTKEG